MNALRKFSIVIMTIFFSSCMFLYGPKLIIDRELTPIFLERLAREYGNSQDYYFISSNKMLVKFNSGDLSMREQVTHYAYEKIKKAGVCKSDPILDKTGSWFDESENIYINFFCAD